MDKLSWNLLRIFAAIGEAGGVTRAAEGLGLSQPAVSQSLARLEAALDTVLVDRGARDFALTEAGAAIHAEAVAMHRSVERIGTLAGHARARLEIAVIPDWPSEVFDEALRLFHQRYPQTPVRIDVLSSMDILARLRATGRGIGVCLLPRPLDDLECRLLDEPEWSVFCGVEHAMFGRDEISLDELRAEPFVAFTCAGSPRGFEPMDPLSRGLGLGQNVIATSTSPDEVRRMIVAGLGLGVMPWTTTREAHRAGLLWPLRITHETLAAHIYLVHPPSFGEDAVAASFAALVAEVQDTRVPRA
ncbi:LysR family transcriptional regulator [Paracoccus sanguinis]|uniref:LysR family transcriptional regulator n=1 Tax=Paracoccus sanguinis TaxID=1545044 RepID=UPI0014520D8D|nr:LysR family transcriptional regulator [Paracoccus sanguinis]QJD16302.1 LysR family transcriptional regulator [Paracoccus sanguinis]